MKLKSIVVTLALLLTLQGCIVNDFAGNLDDSDRFLVNTTIQNQYL